MASWLPLESNPDVLNAALARLGVSGGSFSDVWGLDAEALGFVAQPVLAVLLLFPVSVVEKATQEREKQDPVNATAPPLFIKQTIANACGTIALLHAVLNNSRALTLAGASNELAARLRPLTPGERTAALEADDAVKTIHAASATEGQTEAPSADEDVDLHFIAFVESEGRVFELDGRKESPVDHGSTLELGFLQSAVQVIQNKFIALDPEGNNFTVIALSQNQE
ncbi:peptidase C12, ubiquitin carboxyl-terminal hydrolase [Obelidium mucronatum]|nr:peptidase C12, ubiquitin carboxyl-terminal hydrolase [Obelidium mucronatum]